MTPPLVAPFPYFGGKRRAAPAVWRALGDPSGYVEPFAGSAAVLLARPRFKGRRVETLNDADGWLVNTWRAIQLAPEAVAGHAAGPVTEIDYHARLAWLQERRTPDLVAWLEGDPEAYDAKAAAWWLYVAACGIGDPWNAGPWRVVDGHLTKTAGNAGKGIHRELPHLGNAGRGIHRKLPHLGNAGRGIHRKLPHLGDAGKGIHRELPHLGDAGKGIHRELGSAGQGLAQYMSRLAHRLAHVRITCGDWRRVLTPSVVRAGTGGDGARAIFLDPPYATSGDVYAHGDTDGGVSAAVRDWCLTATGYRIVLAGYDSEHDELLDQGWTRTAGKSGRGSGYSTNRANGRREQLWLSPDCLHSHHQDSLLADEETA